MTRWWFLPCLALLFGVGFCPASSAQENQEQRVMLEGRVVGPDGMPIEGARIYVALSDTWYAITRGYGRTQATPELLGVTNPEGAFRVAASRQDVARDSRAALVAVGPEGTNLGVDWAQAHLFDVSDKRRQELASKDPALAEKWRAARVLRLAHDDVPVQGRIIGVNAQPVAGARVRVGNIQQVRDGDLSGYVEFAKRDNPRDYDDARRRSVAKTFFGEFGRRDGFGDLIAATTDEDGRFTLNGFGRNRVGWLIIDGAGIATDRVLIRSEEGQKLRMRDGDAIFDFYPARFEYTSRESAPVEGTAIDQETGEPVAGVVIENLEARTFPQGVCSTTTDESGRYRLAGLPVGERMSLLASAHGSPHLPSVQVIDVPRGKKAVTHDWKLKRGTWIEGRVFNAGSGHPIWCHLHYFAFRDNPHVASAAGFRGSLSYPTRPPYSTDADGRYRIPGLPGRGIVAVKVLDDPEGNHYPTNKGQENIAGSRHAGYWTEYDTLPSACRASQFHGVREVSPKEGTLRVVQDFPLVPSVTLTGRVLDADGRPLTGFKYAGARDTDFFMHPVSGDEFVVYGYDSTFPRRLIFWHKERRLAGTVVLRGEQRSPIEVKLEPQGTLIGRVVDDDGSPISGLLLEVAPLLAPRPPTTVSALPEANYKTDDDGRFRIEGVAPRLGYNLVTRLPSGKFRQVVHDAAAERGEIKDLGNLKLLPLKRARE